MAKKIGPWIILALALALVGVGLHDFVLEGSVDVTQVGKTAVEEYKKSNPPLNETQIKKTAIDDFMKNNPLASSVNTTAIAQKAVEDFKENNPCTATTVSESKVKTEDWLKSMAPAGTIVYSEGIIPTEEQFLTSLREVQASAKESKEALAGALNALAVKNGWASFELANGVVAYIYSDRREDGMYGLFVTVDDKLSASADLPDDGYIPGSSITRLSMKGMGDAQINYVTAEMGLDGVVIDTGTDNKELSTENAPATNPLYTKQT